MKEYGGAVKVATFVVSIEILTAGSPTAEAALTATGAPELMTEPDGLVNETVGRGGTQVTDLVATALRPRWSTTVAVIT